MRALQPSPSFARFASRAVMVSASVVMLGGALGREASAGGPQPEGWDAGLELAAAVDINPDPRVVEINLEARIDRVVIAPGQTVDAWTYGGSIPGPLIRVHVGDRLIVH